MATERASAPPAARLALRVGVTGHRQDRLAALGAGDGPLRASIRAVLERIAEVARAAARAAGSAYAPGEPLLRVVSPLAEGADRLVAREALELGFELEAPLPFPRDQYETDFGGSESRRAYRELLARAAAVLELDGSRRNAREAYEAAGRVVLRHCDVLVAVWDGEGARGQGGTAQMVREASDLELPVVWIDAHPPHAAASLASSGGTLRKGDLDLEVLARLATLLAPPAAPARHMTRAAAGHHGPRHDQGALHRTYLAERTPRWSPGVLFRVFVALVSWRAGKPAADAGSGTAMGSPTVNGGETHLLSTVEGGSGAGAGSRAASAGETRLVPAAEDGLAPPMGSAGAPGALPVGQDVTGEGDQVPMGSAGAADALGPHYRWADRLAGHYAGLYRSSFLLNYLLGASAVLAAVSGHALASSHGPPLAFGVLELAFLVAILGITFTGRRRRWHERWLDYRLLAEQLRQAGLLAPLGRTLPAAAHPPAHLTYGDPRGTWVAWHVRALMRSAPLASGVMDASYLGACQDLLARSLEGQVRYHHDAAAASERLHHRLHRLGQGFFGITSLVCAAHLLHVSGSPAEHGEAGGWLGLLILYGVVVLPAYGAAFAAILSQGEFERIAERSRAMREKLAELAPPLAQAEEAGEVLPSRRLGQIAEAAAAVMVADLLDWRVVFQGKPLVLPG
jgi:hypothetical protein